jgi:hypothetical protein
VLKAARNIAALKALKSLGWNDSQLSISHDKMELHQHELRGEELESQDHGQSEKESEGNSSGRSEKESKGNSSSGRSEKESEGNSSGLSEKEPEGNSSLNPDMNPEGVSTIPKSTKLSNSDSKRKWWGIGYFLEQVDKQKKSRVDESKS